MELTLHVQIHNIPDNYFTDDEYDNTHEYVTSVLKELAEGLEGRLYDMEIK